MLNMTIKLNKSNQLKVIAWCIGALVLTSCLSDDIEYNGRLSLSVTDAPTDDAKHVWITFSSVEVHRAKGSEIFPIDPVQRIDLLAFSGGTSAPLLTLVELPAGNYEWMRFTIDAVEMELNDATKPALQIPPDALENLKVVSGFTIPLDGIANITVDFDLRKSILANGGVYELRPALRLVDDAQSGNIFGDIDLKLLTNESRCTMQDVELVDGRKDKTASDAAIYVYKGFDAGLVDMSAAEGSPIATARVKYEPSTEINRYSIGYLPAVSTGEGSGYFLALTCDADLDVPNQTDAIKFIALRNAWVKGNRLITYVDFVAPTPTPTPLP